MSQSGNGMHALMLAPVEMTCVNRRNREATLSSSDEKGSSMTRICDFEGLFQSLFESEPSGVFEYVDAGASFQRIARNHFRSQSQLRGVYILRQRSSRDVLYIGKGGTVDNGGKWKKQDLVGRLTNVRSGDQSANSWFAGVVAVVGPILIEYVLLTLDCTPAYVEAMLLQAYLNDNGELPQLNRGL
ncbi:MAG: hypothetical protein DWQ34_13315 [Planctomycetota bacterium]|nr:MAG: hypothetical protein DWQ29_14050 [Planctomycetota bacterium]REJ92277.1 MAG: hypothetical protein DWQ34_13315 [Planctomycetota bacterium]REK30618.1 MAG: hypothetical protein DWQ41_01305 [Planctomycetota bacterium]REK32992.1 MAG: hypothetical protein DWQ45_15405 [Planctomycetota bacterium]